jgi:hypothetical protein
VARRLPAVPDPGAGRPEGIERAAQQPRGTDVEIARPLEIDLEPGRRGTAHLLERALERRRIEHAAVACERQAPGGGIEDRREFHRAPSWPAGRRC